MIVPALPCHACQLAVKGLRKEDADEVKATSGDDPAVVLPRSIAASKKAWTFVGKDGMAVAIFGVADWPGIPEIGVPWLLCSSDFPQYVRDILINAKPIIKEMGLGYRRLVNYTDMRHINNLGWLEWAGFRFDKFEPEYGVEKRPFLRFSKEIPNV